MDMLQRLVEIDDPQNSIETYIRCVGLIHTYHLALHI